MPDPDVPNITSINLTRLGGRPLDSPQTYSIPDAPGGLAGHFGEQGADTLGFFTSPVGGAERRAASIGFSNALRAHPLTSAVWCKHNPDANIATLTGIPGAQWADGVHYAPTVIGYESLSGRRARHVYEIAQTGLTADGPVTTYECGHCAYVASLAHLAAHPRQQASGYDAMLACVVACLDPANLNGYLPPGPEEIGGTLSNVTNTVGLDPTLPNSCGTCGLLGHNARTCTRSARAYAKVGIEIEGLWNNLRETRRRAAAEGMGGCQDGSVRVNPDSNAEGYEFQTNPGTLREALSQLVAYYPDETNDSCGMHVHVSFNVSTDASLLATQQFFDYFRARWNAWGQREHVWGYNAVDPGASRGTFWHRLFGQNDYCRVNSSTERNILSMDRYHQLNFSAWNEHRTVECRLLPMFKSARLGVSAVQELLAIFEDYLHDQADFPAVDVVMAPPALVPLASNSFVDDPDTWMHDARYEVDAEEPPAQEGGTVRVWSGMAEFMSVREALAKIRA